MRQAITDERAREILWGASVVILDMDDGAFRFRLEDGREMLCEVYGTYAGETETTWTLDGADGVAE